MLNKDRPEVIEALIDSLKDDRNLHRIDILCDFQKKVGVKLTSVEEFDKWLNFEYIEPYKITRLEYEILKYFEKYPAIGRSGENSVYIDQWEEVETLNETFSSHLFQFIKEGESIMISDILNYCEVID